MVVLVHFVKEKMCAAVRVMVFHQVGEGVVGKPHVVQRHIQHLAVISTKNLLDALFQERRFPHAFRPLDADNAGVPVDAMQQFSLKFHAHLLDASL